MTAKDKPRILVVGPQAAFDDMLHALEQTGRFQLNYSVDTKTTPIFLRWKPQLILLHVPDEKRAAEQSLLWLKRFASEVPVVVISTAADLSLYLACMTCGAFDYFTSYTPLNEILRVLDRALHWERATAA